MFNISLFVYFFCQWNKLRLLKHSSETEPRFATITLPDFNIRRHFSRVYRNFQCWFKQQGERVSQIRFSFTLPHRSEIQTNKLRGTIKKKEKNIIAINSKQEPTTDDPKPVCVSSHVRCYFFIYAFNAYIRTYTLPLLFIFALCRIISPPASIRNYNFHPLLLFSLSFSCGAS